MRIKIHKDLKGMLEQIDALEEDGEAYIIDCTTQNFYIVVYSVDLGYSDYINWKTRVEMIQRVNDYLFDAE